jgi:hypothetical protein
MWMHFSGIYSIHTLTYYTSTVKMYKVNLPESRTHWQSQWYSAEAYMLLPKINYNVSA